MNVALPEVLVGLLVKFVKGREHSLYLQDVCRSSLHGA